MKRGAPDHWKMQGLARRLKVPVRYGIAWANGTMERLWHYTAKYHPQGDVGRAPDWAIAEACGWPASDAASLIDALIDMRFLVRSTAHRLLVHDWPQHADDAVKKTLQRNGLAFFCPEKSATDAGNKSPALPLPFLALPLKTIPASNDAEVGVFPVAEKPATTKAKRLITDDPVDFQEFWDERWRSEDRAAAVKAFRKAATSVLRQQSIMVAVRNQKPEMLLRDKDKRPYMSTWLNKERFADEAESDLLLMPSRASPQPSFQFKDKHERDKDETLRIAERIAAQRQEHRL